MTKEERIKRIGSVAVHSLCCRYDCRYRRNGCRFWTFGFRTTMKLSYDELLKVDKLLKACIDADYREGILQIVELLYDRAYQT